MAAEKTNQSEPGKPDRRRSQFVDLLGGMMAEKEQSDPKPRPPITGTPSFASPKTGHRSPTPDETSSNGPEPDYVQSVLGAAGLESTQAGMSLTTAGAATLGDSGALFYASGKHQRGHRGGTAQADKSTVEAQPFQPSSVLTNAQELSAPFAGGSGDTQTSTGQTPGAAVTSVPGVAFANRPGSSPGVATLKGEARSKDFQGDVSKSAKSAEPAGEATMPSDAQGAGETAPEQETVSVPFTSIPMGSADSDEPENSAKAAQTSIADRADSARASTLAFAARLVPLGTAQATQQQSGSPETFRELGRNGENKAHTEALSGTATAQAKTGDSKTEKSGPKELSGEMVPAAAAERSGSISQAAQPDLTAAPTAARSGSLDSQTAPSGRFEDAPAVKHAAMPVEAAKPTSPARDITIQVNQGEQRVDLKLSERAGEVHVSVRTPDAQLAGALREDLPTLSGKLEQSGFRTETLHLPGSSSERTLSEPASSNPSQDGQSQPRQGGQQQQEEQQQPRRPKPAVVQPTTDQKREDFQWLMSHPQ
ncbi:MAG: hypothetical protein JO323_16485 [Acidobacteriia bacterium]|nr:hypothetical protein [Terriglobia bacterium]